MKKRNIILVSFISLIVLGSFAGHLFINGKSLSTRKINKFYANAGPLFGKEVSINEAQSILPFKVSLPTEFGSPVLVKLDEENKFLYAIYSDKKLTSDMSPEDILDNGGIILMESPNTSSQENDLRLDAAIKTINETAGDFIKKITINGHHGVRSGNVQHVVYWFTDSTNFQITANPNVPFSYLIEIAESIGE